MDDLVLLKTVSEEELVRTLEARFFKNEIYVRMTMTAFDLEVILMWVI